MNKNKSAKTKRVLNLRILIEQDEDGIFIASVPSMQGCYTEGDSFEEAVKNIKDVISLRLSEEKEKTTVIDDSRTQFIGFKNIEIPYGVPSHYYA